MCYKQYNACYVLSNFRKIHKMVLYRSYARNATFAKGILKFWNNNVRSTKEICTERTESFELFIEDQVSCCRLIWLRPPPSVSKLSLFLSLPVCCRSSILRERGEGVGMEPNHTTQESLVLYKSFKTL